LSGLLRRREVFLPSAWGWLLLLLTAAAVALFLGRNLHAFLAVSAPVGAKLLVVEGWMGPKGLDQAIAAFRAGGYERVVTTGGPIEAWPKPPQATYAELAADYLKQHGLAGVPVTAVPSPASAQDRTFLNAVMVREWTRRAGVPVEALDVFSVGTHARRSWLLYRMALGPSVRIGVHAARNFDYDDGAWWRSSEGSRDVLEQAVQFFWVKCFFWPGSPGSALEKWAVAR
jgi:hypothetical protein